MNSPKAPILLMLAIVLVSALPALSQRRITPVTPPAAAGEPVKERPDTTRRRVNSLVHMHDTNGNVVYVDTITGMEVADTAVNAMLPKPPKMEYPLLSSLSVGVDIWDPVMRALGEHYGLIGFSAGVSLHNRYRPMVEIGLGNANYKPEDGNFTYKGKMAPWFKIGADYNFFYNSDPAYEVYAGLRVGFSSFNYEITDVTLNSDYWDETSHFAVPSQRASATWMELMLGLRVKIWRQISMGWNVRYHSVLKMSQTDYGKPWYIPGYGTRTMSWQGSFSIYYTIDLNNRRPKKVIDTKPSSSDGDETTITDRQ